MAIVGKARTYSSVKADLDVQGMNIPGSTMTMVDFDIVINNVLPTDPSCADCRDQSLARLHYIGKYRDHGLGLGRYTGVNGPVLRTYPLTYNQSWMEFYRNKARNAAIRGKKLNDSTGLAHMHHKIANSAHYDVAIKALGGVL